jgi:uncharacterized membrane protein
MKHKGIYIFAILLWLIFGLIYLYPHPDVIAADISPHSNRSELDEYLISGIYTGWYMAIIVMSIGVLTILFGFKRRSFVLLSLSLLTGMSYTFYTTRLEVFIEQADVMLNHGISVAASSVNVILKHYPDFIFMELLFFLFAIGVLIILFLNLKHITNSSTADAPKSRRAR